MLQFAGKIQWPRGVWGRTYSKVGVDHPEDSKVVFCLEQRSVS